MMGPVILLFSWPCASRCLKLRMFSGNWLCILTFSAGARQWRVGSNPRSTASHPVNVKLRLYGFALAVVLLAALVGWAGHSAWQKLKQLRKNFGAVQSESFHLADHVEASILNLNETVLRFDLRRDSADKAHFLKEGEELKRWIRKSSATTPLELELLNQIEVALEAYLTRTANLLEERAQAGSVP